MTTAGTADELVERLKRRSPEWLDLLTAESDADFEAAFESLLERALTHLERNARNFEGLNEVGLTAVLVGSLSAPGLFVTQEAHSNGHVDLTIEARDTAPVRRKLGEAKIYDGPEYHLGGLDQLLGRYTTGREGRGLLIEYVRKADISKLIRRLRHTMDNSLPHDQQGKTSDHRLKWSFLSTHRHSCGDDVEVGHVGCNLGSGPIENAPADSRPSMDAP